MLYFCVTKFKLYKEALKKYLCHLRMQKICLMGKIYPHFPFRCKSCPTEDHGVYQCRVRSLKDWGHIKRHRGTEVSCCVRPVLQEATDYITVVTRKPHCWGHIESHRGREESVMSGLVPGTSCKGRPRWGGHRTLQSPWKWLYMRQGSRWRSNNLWGRWWGEWLSAVNDTWWECGKECLEMKARRAANSQTFKPHSILMDRL